MMRPSPSWLGARRRATLAIVLAGCSVLPSAPNPTGVHGTLQGRPFVSVDSAVFSSTRGTVLAVASDHPDLKRILSLPDRAVSARVVWAEAPARVGRCSIQAGSQCRVEVLDTTSSLATSVVAQEGTIEVLSIGNGHVDVAISARFLPTGKMEGRVAGSLSTLPRGLQ